MKKSLLSLIMLFAFFGVTLGQWVEVTSPFVAGNTSYDWRTPIYQRGATVVFEGTYDDEGADSVECNITMFENWSVTAAHTVSSDGSAGSALPIDGILQDTLTIPLDFTLAYTKWMDTVIIFQARVWYDPLMGADVYSNGIIGEVVEAFTDSVAFYDPNLVDWGSAGELLRGGKFNFYCYYGIEDVKSVEVRLTHRNEFWADIRTIAKWSYDADNVIGVPSGNVDVDIEIPEDFILTSEVPANEGIYLRIWVAYGDGTSKMLFLVPTIVDYYTPTEVVADSAITLKYPATDTIMASVLPVGAKDSVLFTSADEGVVTVDADGIITPIAEGTAYVYSAAFGDPSVKDSTLVTVVDVRVTGVALDKNTLTLGIGGKETLTATVSPEHAENKNVTWESDAEFIATVDASGEVTGVGEGTANIIVTTDEGGFTDACVVNVIATSVNDLRMKNIEVYPNPASSHLNINGLVPGIYKVEILNVLGSRFESHILKAEGILSIRIESIPSGIYLLRIEGKNSSYIKKFSKD